MSDTDGWPPHYIDPDAGARHAWDAVAEDAEDGEPPYTYQELVQDQADASGQDMAEWFETHGYGEDEKLSPPYVDDDW